MASTKKKRTTTRAKKVSADVPKKAAKVPGKAVAEAAVEAAESQSQAPRVTDLFRWNKSLALIYAVQALAILVAGAAYKLPVLSQYITSNPLSEGAVSTVVASRHLFDIDLVWVVALFFIISAIAHTAMAGIYRMRYEADIATGVNRLRWIDYAASGSVMMVGIALLSGIYDGATLLAMVALTAAMAFCQLAMEAHNRGVKETNWLMYIVGVAAGLVPWLIIVATLLSANIYGDGAIPTFVYWIVGSLGVLSVGFAVHIYLQYVRKGKWADYLYVERGYMVLSLVAKTALAWQIFTGVLRP